MAIGYLSVSRDGKSLLAAAVATGRAALVGIIPELVLGVLWMAGLVHPTILQPNGLPMVLGHGITDLCIRAGVAVPPTHLLLVPLAALIPAAVVGALGAMTAQFVSAFREGLRGLPLQPQASQLKKVIEPSPAITRVFNALRLFLAQRAQTRLSEPY